MLSDFYLPLYVGKSDNTVIYDSNNMPIGVTTTNEIATCIVDAINDQKKNLEEIESLKKSVNACYDRLQA